MNAFLPSCSLVPAAIVAFASGALPFMAAAADGGEGAAAPQRWRVEFKRQATDRGTAEETTKSQFKLEYFPDGAVELLRLEAPFPDEETDFAGDPSNPRLGDVKVRVGFRAVSVRGRPLASFFELTLPTASPESLGSGKYQLSVGLRTRLPLALSEGASGQFFSAQIQQVASIAGDAARNDINQTKFEFELRQDWSQQRLLKFTVKPVIDWVQDARTGAVGELEGGWGIGRDWTLAVMGGALLWGEGVPSTYGKRVELKAARRF